MSRTLLFWLLFFAALNSANAQVVFDEDVLGVTEKTGPKKVKAEFSFQNSGQYSVKILRVRSSCDCITASVGKRTIAPGEKGKVDVTIHIGKRPRTDLTTINFTTDDPHSNAVLRISLVVEGKSTP